MAKTMTLQVPSSGEARGQFASPVSKVVRGSMARVRTKA